MDAVAADAADAGEGIDSAVDEVAPPRVADAVDAVPVVVVSRRMTTTMMWMTVARGIVRTWKDSDSTRDDAVAAAAVVVAAVAALAVQKLPNSGRNGSCRDVAARL